MVITKLGTVLVLLKMGPWPTSLIILQYKVKLSSLVEREIYNSTCWNQISVPSWMDECKNDDLQKRTYNHEVLGTSVVSAKWFPKVKSIKVLEIKQWAREGESDMQCREHNIKIPLMNSRWVFYTSRKRTLLR